MKNQRQDVELAGSGIEEQLLEREFPIRKTRIYMNNASIGPLPTCSVEAARQYLEHQNATANAFYPQWDETAGRARQRFAPLINATPDEIGLVGNTTKGLLLLANGLEWHKGDNIIIPEFEFPANVYPWKNLEAKGVELRFVPERNARFELEDFARLVDRRTRLLTASFVEYATGFRQNLEALGRLCRENKLIFCVDAIQGIGVIPLDVQAANIDFLALDGHKWLLGPYGIGFVFCRRALMEQLRGFRGWMSVRKPSHYEDLSQELAESARRFEEGSLNYLGLYALERSVELITKLGIGRIHRKVMAVTGHLAGGLARKGYRVMSPLAETERSGIIAFESPRFNSQDLFKGLLAKNVICAVRRNMVRMSPHFYNSLAEMDEALRLLPDH
jgi:cysteine desulfurase / selenocysteine lyase